MRLIPLTRLVNFAFFELSYPLACCACEILNMFLEYLEYTLMLVRLRN